MAKKESGEGFGIFISILIILGIMYYLSPYWTVIQIEKATREGDKKYLNDHIKFKQLRKSIKNEIKNFSKDALKTSDNVIVNVAGEIFGGAVIETAMTQIEPVIKEMVSANGLINMVKNNEYPEDNKVNKKAIFTKKGINYINLLKTGRFVAYNKFEFPMKYEDEEEENGEGEMCVFVCELKGFKWIYKDIKFKENWEQYLKEHLNVNMSNTSDDKNKHNNNDDDE